MKYKEIELTEMLPANWDGNTRQMLVWNDNDTSCHLAYVIGYTDIAVRRNCFLEYDSVWCCSDAAKYGPIFCAETWQHCADIPDEEPEACDEIEKLKAENNKLKANIKSLKDERIKMADSVSSAVWNELMERAKNIEGPVNTSMAGFGFNDISDIVLNKIIDYKPEKKLRRMTYKELDEWLEQGKGVVKIADHVSNTITYDCESRNQEVYGGYKICGYDEDTWHYPMIEV